MKKNKIVKVNADKNYKDEYVKINESIYSVDFAKQLLPRLKKKINKVMAKNFTEDSPKLAYRTYPSNEKILELIEKEKNRIYDYLNLNGITGEGADIVKAGVVYLYLSRNTKYDISIIELTKINYYKTRHVTKLINENIKDFLMLKNEKANSKQEDNAELDKQLDLLSKKIMFLQAKKATKQNSITNRMLLKSIYNVLIKKEGVCADFSYANQYLLEGLGIHSLTITTADLKNDFSHVINAVEFNINNKKQYYLVDITEGYIEFHSGSDNLMLNGFAEPVKGLIEKSDKILLLEKMLNLKNKKNLCLIESTNDTEEINKFSKQIITEYELEKYVGCIFEFVMNGYENLNLDELVQNEK